jgi:hypothetical protein
MGCEAKKGMWINGRMIGRENKNINDIGFQYVCMVFESPYKRQCDKASDKLNLIFNK